MGRPQQYSDKEIDEFLAIAQEIGIGKAIKELGYPKSFDTAQAWAKNRGVNVNVDPVMARAKQFDLLYKEEDMLHVLQEGIQDWFEYMSSNKGEIAPDDKKKMAEALSKYMNSWLLLKGKANEIKGTVEKTEIDLTIEEFMRNAERIDKAKSEENAG